MIRELLSEKLITLVFGVVLRQGTETEDIDRNRFLQMFIEVQIFDVCKGMHVNLMVRR